MCKLQNGIKNIYVELRIIFQSLLFRCNIHKTNVVTLIVITHTFIAPRCDTIGVPLLWSFLNNVVLMVLSENCDFCLEKLYSLMSASLLSIISPSSVYVC